MIWLGATAKWLVILLGVNRSEADWQGYFQELTEYREKYGYFPDPKSKSRLAIWLYRQTRPWTRLSDGQLRQLIDLGFQFPYRERGFIRHYLELVEFHHEHGHCRVIDSLNKPLAKWVRRMRQEREKLPPSWIGRLDTLGFIWDVLEEDWQRHVADLKEFIAEHGHCRVPKGYPPCPSLFYWVSNVRSGNSRTSRKRRAELKAIGFDFSPWSIGDHHVARAFARHIPCLIEYKQQYGHVDVPTNCKDYPALGSWLLAPLSAQGSG